MSNPNFKNYLSICGNIDLLDSCEDISEIFLYGRNVMNFLNKTAEILFQGMFS